MYTNIYIQYIYIYIHFCIVKLIRTDCRLISCCISLYIRFNDALLLLTFAWFKCMKIVNWLIGFQQLCIGEGLHPHYKINHLYHQIYLHNMTMCLFDQASTCIHLTESMIAQQYNNSIHSIHMQTSKDNYNGTFMYVLALDIYIYNDIYCICMYKLQLIYYAILKLCILGTTGSFIETISCPFHSMLAKALGETICSKH